MNAEEIAELYPEDFSSFSSRLYCIWCETNFSDDIKSAVPHLETEDHLKNKRIKMEHTAAAAAAQAENNAVAAEDKAEATEGESDSSDEEDVLDSSSDDNEPAIDARVRKYPSELEIRDSRLFCKLCDKHMQSVSRAFVVRHTRNPTHTAKKKELKRAAKAKAQMEKEEEEKKKAAEEKEKQANAEKSEAPPVVEESPISQMRKYPQELEIRGSILFCKFCEEVLDDCSTEFVESHRASKPHKKKMADGLDGDTEGGAGETRRKKGRRGRFTRTKLKTTKTVEVNQPQKQQPEAQQQQTEATLPTATAQPVVEEKVETEEAPKTRGRPRRSTTKKMESPPTAPAATKKLAAVKSTPPTDVVKSLRSSRTAAVKAKVQEIPAAATRTGRRGRRRTVVEEPVVEEEPEVEEEVPEEEPEEAESAEELSEEDVSDGDDEYQPVQMMNSRSTRRSRRGEQIEEPAITLPSKRGRVRGRGRGRGRGAATISNSTSAVASKPVAIKPAVKEEASVEKEAATAKQVISVNDDFPEEDFWMYEHLCIHLSKLWCKICYEPLHMIRNDILVHLMSARHCEMKQFNNGLHGLNVVRKKKKTDFVKAMLREERIALHTHVVKNVKENMTNGKSFEGDAPMNNENEENSVALMRKRRSNSSTRSSSGRTAAEAGYTAAGSEEAVDAGTEERLSSRARMSSLANTVDNLQDKVLPEKKRKSQENSPSVNIPQVSARNPSLSASSEKVTSQSETLSPTNKKNRKNGAGVAPVFDISSDDDDCIIIG